ncbi:BppU family phage baseplate upper protein [Enterococcus faecium]|uniref:BppU family phage baseplate upper protein n=1 Tax=Enterococcus faecium TaxID=1352 RepID=UPI0021C9F882|nr:BppU family phage baseplate upper protein [Enterococcus faecium]
MAFKINESIIVIQAEATSPNRTDVVFWSHDRGTAKLRMKLVRKNGIPQSLPEGTTVPIRLMFRSATAEGGYGKHDYLATVEDPVNGIVSIVLEDNILGYVGTVEGSVYIDFPNDRSLDTAGRFTFDIKRSQIDDSTPELEDYYFNGFSQTIDKIEKILADGKQEIEQKIAESETQIEAKLKDTNDKITKANQKITEYDQNLNELRNDLKLSEAWAWSADGTDRFTDKYPIDNLLPNSMFNSQMGWTASMLDVGSTQSGIANGEAWLEDLTATTSRWKQWQIYFDNNRYPDTFELIKANPNKRVNVSVDAKVEGNTIKNPGVVDLSLRSSTGDNWVRLRVDDTKISSEYIRYTAIGTLPSDFNNVQNFRLILTFNGNGRATFTKPKLAIGNDGFYTPAPSEDPLNAYPQYRGLALLPSDLPDDYSWDVTPEYTEKGLNNTVSLTEPETVLGLKNFKDGVQIDGVDVATVKNLGSVLQSGSGLTTIQSDKQSAFDEFSYEFERIGDRVFFHARVKTNSTTAVASHVSLLEIPLGFQSPIGGTIGGIPLSVVQWTTPQGEISALVITDSTGKQVVKFATNRVGNHYISGEWRTADSYPETK